MLGIAMYTTIRKLWEIGKNKSEIARIIGHDWKTVAKVIKNIESGKEELWIKCRESIVDHYKEKVVKLLERELSAVRIHEEFWTLKKYIGCY